MLDSRARFSIRDVWKVRSKGSNMARDWRGSSRCRVLPGKAEKRRGQSSSRPRRQPHLVELIINRELSRGA